MNTKTSNASVVDLSVLNRYRRLTILVIGDVMLDKYILTDVNRTSPEAPVAIAAVRGEDYVPGGAANVAANLKAMGAKVFLAGIVGKDSNTSVLRALLEERGIKTNLFITDAVRPTTLKTRILAQGQQILRIDREEKKPICESVQKRLIGAIEHKSPKLDGVIISDYAKGVCTPEFIRSLLELMRRRNIPVLCDPKGIDFSKYRGVEALTPNLKETQDASGIPITDDVSLLRAARKIRRITDAKAIVVTRGRDGVSLFAGKKPAVHIPAHARVVFVVTGAGDTFISHFALARFSGLSYSEAARFGNFASAIVVAKLGVAVVNPEELSAFIRGETFSTKLKSLDELRAIVRALKSSGKRVVFTNGCFDLIHIGHIKFLQAARTLGDCLIVGINTDASVRKVKGPGRPLISENERADLLAALHWVDYVVLFDETTPEPLLQALKPDILVKGKNLRPEEVVGYKLVKRYGGQIHRLRFFSNVSTSERLRGILENLKNRR